MSTKIEWDLARQQQLFDAVKAIGKGYMTIPQLRRDAGRVYGLEFEEALEMAYENLLNEVRGVTRGMRRPS